MSIWAQCRLNLDHLKRIPINIVFHTMVQWCNQGTSRISNLKRARAPVWTSHNLLLYNNGDVYVNFTRNVCKIILSFAPVLINNQYFWIYLADTSNARWSRSHHPHLTEHVGSMLRRRRQTLAQIKPTAISSWCMYWVWVIFKSIRSPWIQTIGIW